MISQRQLHKEHATEFGLNINSQTATHKRFLLIDTKYKGRFHIKCRANIDDIAEEQAREQQRQQLQTSLLPAQSRHHSKHHANAIKSGYFAQHC